MSAFEVLVATCEAGEVPVAAAMESHRQRWDDAGLVGEWTWYTISFRYGRDPWHPYAYVDMDGSWHSQYRHEIDPVDGELGTHIPITDWRNEVKHWVERLPDDGHLTLVRCKG